ncbi:MAG: DUF2934 domain-containing protein [Verrucomicrobia bacterium]|nr:DUF2934 domain-containing protein [Verrucomicrobiota bacterium]
MGAKTKRTPPPQRIAATLRPEPTHDEIALCAMSIWESEGRPQGREVEHWLLAEARLREGCQADGGVEAGGPARRSIRRGSKRRLPGRVVL